MTKRIYLDYAATAPLCDASAQAMAPYLDADKGFQAQYNANSLHSEGRAAFAALEQARAEVSKILGVRQHEVFFTSGATESNNTALFGIVAAALRTNRNRVPHVVTSSIEHASVDQVAMQLEALGLAKVTYVKPTRSGHIDPASVEAALTEDTVLVSVMAVNNEVGSLNDIAALGNIAHNHNALFHTDMVQLLGKEPVNLSELPVDAASFSAHKIGGPKGVGLLYLNPFIAFVPWLVGGGQENGMRSGTQNVCGAVGFAAAMNQFCADVHALEEEATRLRALRDTLYEQLAGIDGVTPSVSCEAGSRAYAPHIVHVCVDGVESETLILQLDLAGFAVSGGSACSSRSLKASRILTEIGLNGDLALGALRLSLGPDTSLEDIDSFIQAFTAIVHNVGS